MVPVRDRAADRLAVADVPVCAQHAGRAVLGLHAALELAHGALVVVADHGDIVHRPATIARRPAPLTRLTVLATRRLTVLATIEENAMQATHTTDRRSRRRPRRSPTARSRPRCSRPRSYVLLDRDTGWWQFFAFGAAPDIALFVGIAPGLAKGQLHPRAVPLYNALHRFAGPLAFASRRRRVPAGRLPRRRDRVGACTSPSTGSPATVCARPMASSAPELTPRAREIVDAARELLEAEGPEGLSMRRVADRIGIKAPSIYKHLPDKEALEAAVISAGLRRVGGGVRGRGRRSRGARPRLPRATPSRHPHLYRLMTDRAARPRQARAGRRGARARPRSSGRGRRSRRRARAVGLRPRHDDPRAQRPLPAGRRPRRRLGAGDRRVPAPDNRAHATREPAHDRASDRDDEDPEGYRAGIIRARLVTGTRRRPARASTSSRRARASARTTTSGPRRSGST